VTDCSAARSAEAPARVRVYDADYPQGRDAEVLRVVYCVRFDGDPPSRDRVVVPGPRCRVEVLSGEGRAE
jgi:hypothetical protein